ncbi:S41 family peptidase [Salegentibacter chungangensis]|uniref:S41 family peptidase n=1 Tax=Salegentibacter chungangensis TaxID=1335724 RepID=A0ABW3NRN8_9FLAO
MLISPFTASAAEIFALGTLQYSNFERIGSRSAGIFSEILWKKLPNGWEYSLSNEVYRDPDGQSYEGKGIPIDRDLNYPEERSAFFRGFYEEERFTDQALEIIITRHSRH